MLGVVIDIGVDVEGLKDHGSVIGASHLNY
jgi:hypothetical protein